MNARATVAVDVAHTKQISSSLWQVEDHKGPSADGFVGRMVDGEGPVALIKIQCNVWRKRQAHGRNYIIQG